MSDAASQPEESLSLQPEFKRRALLRAGPPDGADQDRIELHAGQLFHIPAVPHDSWVIGNEPYVSLHVLGADKYAK